jgi:hypothetical protein
MTDQNTPSQPNDPSFRPGSDGTTEGNEQSQKSSAQDDGKKPADKPIRPNPDVEGGNGPVNQ